MVVVVVVVVAIIADALCVGGVMGSVVRGELAVVPLL